MKRYMFLFLFSQSIMSSPLDDIREYFIRTCCFKSNSSHTVAWACAYYLAFKKDIFKRENVRHPSSFAHLVQERLWQDAYVALERMLPLRVQLDVIRKKYQHDWQSTKDCFDELNKKNWRERDTYFPCVHLVNEFRKTVKNQREKA